VITTPSSTRRPFLRLSLLGAFFLLFALPWYTESGCGPSPSPPTTFSGFTFFWRDLANVHAWPHAWGGLVLASAGVGVMLAGALVPIYARFGLRFASPARRFFVQLAGALLTVVGSGYFATWMGLGLLMFGDPALHVPFYFACAVLLLLYAHGAVLVVMSAKEWRRRHARHPLRARAQGTSVAP
jgi:hypothetical protein